jgi:pimeloyl-ACP methyl ester carboxylesterase
MPCQTAVLQVPSKEVYVVGHSLGASIASIAALRLNALLPQGVSGAFLYAAPRAGNAAWAAAYNRMMLHKTVRFSNHLDFAVRVPSSIQSCSLGSMSLRAETGRFDYAHVGRAVLLCPERDTGLTEFRVSPLGSDDLDCFANDEVDATASTHQLGSYFDAWRRGYMKYKGHNLSKDVRVEAVMCSGCTVNTQRFKREQLRCPARAGGPVTCTVDAACSSAAAFGATLAVGSITPFRSANMTTCQAYLCQPPAVSG